MRIPTWLLAASLAALSAPARAQLAPSSLAVESGASAPIRGAGRADAPIVLGATRWLEGDVDATFRLAFGSAPETAGRGAHRFVLASAGARWSLLPDPVRPQLSAEAGFRRWSDGRLAPMLAAGAGVEVFVARDLSLTARGAARIPLGSGPPSADLTLGIAAYF
ncbi:MAG TPA: hypothetical protein VLU43_17300 [Anaeromyxobacteraceae bacterium]|nr:hypothetical protein [Anaeromyxobacteraceae bacterium]